MGKYKGIYYFRKCYSSKWRYRKKGDILIKGEQGKEGETYEVHSEGKVFARTFYEEIKTINTYRIKRKRTGKK